LVVVPPEVVAPVEPDVPVLLLVPVCDDPVGEVAPAVPLTVPPAAPMPEADPEAVPETGPVLHAATMAEHASAIKTLVITDSPAKMNRAPA
jgi:hypothetical protein